MGSARYWVASTSDKIVSVVCLDKTMDMILFSRDNPGAAGRVPVCVLKIALPGV